MKYVIISDAASMHIYNFIRTSLTDKNIELYIISQSYRDIPKEYLNFYQQRNVNILSLSKYRDKDFIVKSGLFARIKRVLLKYRLLYSVGKCDVCHVHYLDKLSCIFVWLRHRQFNKILLSFWGSDILRPKRITIELQKRIFKYADLITVTSKNSYDCFIERFGNKHNKKLRIVRLACGGLSFIKEISRTEDNLSCKRYFNIPTNKITITCGYNADPSQHQDIVLEQISEFSETDKGKIHIILPLQYARINEEYITKLINKLKEIGCTYTVFNDYMNYTEIAKYCIATDIFIHVRDTDAFSNSMKEQLYSGSVMIQGNWLIYREFENKDLPIIKISSISEINNAIYKIINIPIKYELEYTKQYIWELWSIESVEKQWEEVIKSISGAFL